MRDFVLLEMESRPGGNARWGGNEVGEYPWSAHYLPVPDKHEELVRELCRELGLLHENGEWDERWLCHSPQERLFLHGRWQEGIEPNIGMKTSDAEQYKRFFERVGEMRASGRFTIPSEVGLAKCGAKERALDAMTMDEWMRQEGFFSPYLRWFADYSTRDDYGTRLDGISAYAALHYFAGRAPEDKGPLTWPEGNGWIVKRLMEKLGRYVKTGQMALRIEQAGTRWRVFTEQTVYECECVIYAAPTFLAPWIVSPAPPRFPVDYAPWLIANLTLDRWPAEKGSEPAWDNVIYDSPALGYVVSTHQGIGRRPDRTVWTYYWAMGDGAGVDQRRLLLGGDWGMWTERILADLERAHPDIRKCVRRVDIFRNGHAMPRPAPGILFSEERRRWLRGSNRLFYANSDLSALSLFEEAQYRGVEAAKGAMRVLGR
jgi:hypothetical protein